MWKLAVLVTLLSFCDVARGYRPGDAVCSLSTDTTCALDEIQPSALDGSVLIYPGGKTRCAFDDYTDPTNGYTANATYFFQVFPNEDQNKSKLLLFFQGGGACFDADTCNFALQCSLGKNATFTTSASAMSSGIFNRSDSENVFRDWNIVHIPYCSGDLHVGNAEHEAPPTGIEAIFQQEQCLDQNRTMYMHGYDNSLSALTWAHENYPNPEQIVIGGASAGSLGSQAFTAFVADMWKLNDTSKYSVLADSYVGVLPNATGASVTLDFFGACDVDLKLSDAVVSACKNHSLNVTTLMSSIMEDVPYSAWLFLSSKADRVQRYYYQFLKDGLLGFPFHHLVSGEDFFAGVMAIIDVYKQVSSHISTFFVEGEQHVFLDNDGYESIESDTNTTLGPFLTKWLAGDINTNSSDSSNAVAGDGSSSSSASSHVNTPSSLLIHVTIVCVLFMASPFVNL